MNIKSPTIPADDPNYIEACKDAMRDALYQAIHDDYEDDSEWPVNEVYEQTLAAGWSAIATSRAYVLLTDGFSDEMLKLGTYRPDGMKEWLQKGKLNNLDAGHSGDVGDDDAV